MRINIKELDDVKHKEKIYRIIFEADTKWGKIFDVALIIVICLSVLVVILESVRTVKLEFYGGFKAIEWFFTFFFTIEYILRVYSAPKKKDYIISFYGVIDLLALLPSYIGLYLTGAESLMVIRAVRLLRIFRLFKLTQYVGEAEILIRALQASRHKITVFLFSIFTIVLSVGAAMYVIEGDVNGFSSIPKGMYWAIVTMTTVGYGDIVPVTDLGKTLAATLMVMGYAIIAVPTGIVTTELANAGKEYQVKKESIEKENCLTCLNSEHAPDAIFCRTCGRRLH